MSKLETRSINCPKCRDYVDFTVNIWETDQKATCPKCHTEYELEWDGDYTEDGEFYTYYYVKGDIK